MNKNGYGGLVEWLCVIAKMLYLLVSWPVYILLYVIESRERSKEDVRHNDIVESLETDTREMKSLEVEE